ncbi:MAG: acyl-ACP--UDP-N-acetylglucosamine O-acyltransferase [Thermodesulfobacteriota bacterium]
MGKNEEWRNVNNEVTVHPTAVVHPTAELDTGVEIGPYAVIGEQVRIGKGTRVASHAVIDRWVTIGKGCDIFQFTSIGAPPQDLQYRGEETVTVIGDNNVIREYVTIHRATIKEEKKTVIGDNNLLMAYVHIAHDSRIGNNVIMANAATLGGHVVIEDHVIVGGLVAVHQFVRLGAHSIIGGASAVSKDVPPYVLAVGNRAHLYGLNRVGLRRHGFTREDINDIKRAYNIIFRSSLPITESLDRLKAEMPDSVHARCFIDFIGAAKRGVAKERGKKRGDGHEAD